jgi:hypothetical protein
MAGKYPKRPSGVRYKCCEAFETHNQKGAFSDEEVYAGDGAAAQETNRLSASGSDVEATRKSDVQGEQHSV